jgi:hypothetical protein
MKLIKKTKTVYVNETRYECEVCRASYATESEANVCEAKCSAYVKGFKYDSYTNVNKAVYDETSVYVSHEAQPSVKVSPSGKKTFLIRHQKAGEIELEWSGPGWYCAEKYTYYDYHVERDVEGTCWKHVNDLITSRKEKLRELAQEWASFKELAKLIP